MPNGKSQKEEILKAEHQQNLKDAAELANLAEQLKADLEKNEKPRKEIPSQIGQAAEL